jgi:quinol monooxygenase YgiN
MSSTAILVSGRAKEGQRDAIYALYCEHVVPHVAADDRLRAVVWSDDDDDPDVWHLVEVFREGSSHRQLLGAPWFQAYVEHAAPLAAEPATVRLLTTRWMRGIE